MGRYAVRFIPYLPCDMLINFSSKPLLSEQIQLPAMAVADSLIQVALKEGLVQTVCCFVICYNFDLNTVRLIITFPLVCS